MTYAAYIRLNDTGDFDGDEINDLESRDFRYSESGEFIKIGDNYIVAADKIVSVTFWEEKKDDREKNAPAFDINISPTDVQASEDFAQAVRDEISFRSGGPLPRRSTSEDYIIGGRLSDSPSIIINTSNIPEPVDPYAGISELEKEIRRHAEED